MKKQVYKYLENAIRNNKFYTVEISLGYREANHNIPRLPNISKLDNDIFIFHEHSVSAVDIVNLSGSSKKKLRSFLILLEDGVPVYFDSTCIYIDYKEGEVINISSLLNIYSTRILSICIPYNSVVIDLFKKYNYKFNNEPHN